MTTYHAVTEPGIAAIVSATFPANRNPVAVGLFQGPVRCNSYWDGGSKDEFRLYDLAERRSYAVPTSHPHFDRKDNGSRCGILELAELPPNCVLVTGGTFCGKPATVRLSFRPENLAALLPAPADPLPPQLASALNVVRSITSSYRRDEFRRRGLGEYSVANPLIAELINRGLAKTNKAGAVSATLAGKNMR